MGEDGDEDDETELEAYTTTIDNEDAVDEFSVFKQCLLSKLSLHLTVYNHATTVVAKDRSNEDDCS